MNMDIYEGEKKKKKNKTKKKNYYQIKQSINVIVMNIFYRENIEMMDSLKHEYQKHYYHSRHSLRQ